MAEVHAKKAEEANQAFQAIEKAKKDRENAVAMAKAKEMATIASITTAHSNNVVA